VSKSAALIRAALIRAALIRAALIRAALIRAALIRAALIPVKLLLVPSNPAPVIVGASILAAPASMDSGPANSARRRMEVWLSTVRAAIPS
jgi:hypothetical protein